MGLRLREGIDPARFFALTGKKLAQSRVAELIGDGLVELTRDNRIRVSSEGFPVLDAVVADLAA
jgi:oxygen-independent coproporphyrinogen-3 oxidase